MTMHEVLNSVYEWLPDHTGAHVQVQGGYSDGTIRLQVSLSAIRRSDKYYPVGTEPGFRLSTTRIDAIYPNDGPADVVKALDAQYNDLCALLNEEPG